MVVPLEANIQRVHLLLSKLIVDKQLMLLKLSATIFFIDDKQKTSNAVSLVLVLELVQVREKLHHSIKCRFHLSIITSRV